MKNKTKIIALIVVFASLLFVTAYASTSDAVENEYYMQKYGNIFPNFNSVYKISEAEGVVDETTGALCTNVTDYKILGKNGFDVSVVRSFNTLSTEGDIFVSIYNDKRTVEKCFSLDFECSVDGATIPVYFDNERELFEADPTFEGRFYSDAQYEGEYWYKNLKSVGTGVIYTIKNPEAIAEMKTMKSYYETFPLAIDTEKSFINLENGTRISKPSLVLCWNERIEDEMYYDFVFQDLNAQTYFFTVIFNVVSGRNQYDSTTDFVGAPHCIYKMCMPGDNVSQTETIHPSGFVYTCYLESEQGVKYFLNGIGNHYDVVGAQDRYGNLYIIDVDSTEFFVTTQEGTKYTVTTDGITKELNGEVEELVAYKTETVNNPKDVYDKYDIDDEYIFTVTRNSGNTNEILPTEIDVTKYYIKREHKYSLDIMHNGYLSAYKLPYRIELPIGLTKHIEYDAMKWIITKPAVNYWEEGYNYPVYKYYETDTNDNKKNTNFYLYTKKGHMNIQIICPKLYEGKVRIILYIKQ